MLRKQHDLLQAMQERNNFKKDFNQHPDTALKEERERGFVSYFGGANVSLAQQKVPDPKSAPREKPIDNRGQLKVTPDATPEKVSDGIKRGWSSPPRSVLGIKLGNNEVSTPCVSSENAFVNSCCTSEERGNGHYSNLSFPEDHVSNSCVFMDTDCDSEFDEEYEVASKVVERMKSFTIPSLALFVASADLESKRAYEGTIAESSDTSVGSVVNTPGDKSTSLTPLEVLTAAPVTFEAQQTNPVASTDDEDIMVAITHSLDEVDTMNDGSNAPEEELFVLSEECSIMEHKRCQLTIQPTVDIDTMKCENKNTVETMELTSELSISFSGDSSGAQTSSTVCIVDSLNKEGCGCSDAPKATASTTNSTSVLVEILSRLSRLDVKKHDRLLFFIKQLECDDVKANTDCSSSGSHDLAVSDNIDCTVLVDKNIGEVVS